MFNIRVENLFGEFVHDICVSCWEDVEKVYFSYRDQFPGYDIYISKVSFYETMLGT